MKFSYPPHFEHDNEPAMWQNPYEFRMTIKFLESIDAKSLLEIGTGYGEMARFLRDIKDMHIRSIDKNPMYAHYDSKELFVADSTSERAYNWALSNAPPGLYDVVYIDGGHDFDTCFHDYNTYTCLARRAVIIHDIDANQAGKYPVEWGPYLVWKKARLDYRTIEIHAKHPENCGVGICIIGGI